MVDTPSNTQTSKVGGFLQQSTAGLPNWAWLLVIGVGIAAAIVIPRFLKKGSTSTPDTSGQGLGLAIDPTTGLPYAVSGLVPGGAYAGGAPPPLPSNAQMPLEPTTLQTLTRGPREREQGTERIPIWTQPDANWSENIGGIPQNVQVTLGQPVPGNYYGKQVFYYPVTYGGTTGYVGEWDLNMDTTGYGNISWPGSYIRSRLIRTG